MSCIRAIRLCKLCCSAAFSCAAWILYKDAGESPIFQADRATVKQGEKSAEARQVAWTCEGGQYDMLVFRQSTRTTLNMLISKRAVLR